MPQLRNGITGDWIGSFINHKGAVWASRMSENASLAITGSADFSAKVWDATTGEELSHLPHEHIVRAVAPAPGPNPAMFATAGHERKLRVWDLKEGGGGSIVSNATDTIPHYEVGAGVHTASIKSVVWCPGSDLIVTAGDDKLVRWWDMRQVRPTATYAIDGTFGSLELTTKTTDRVISVASGKKVYFFNDTGSLQKSHTLPKDVSSVALNWEDRKFVTGSSQETWIRIFDYDSGEEVTICKGHHGPVWTTAFSPDGKLFASGSEDGTIKLWKFTSDSYGMWKAAGEAVTE